MSWFFKRLDKENKEKPEPEQEHDEGEFLITVGSDIEAGIIEAKLESEDVPVLRKYKDAGGYLSIYMGASLYGIDLYVPSKLYEKALEIIKVDEAEFELETENLSDTDVNVIDNNENDEK